MSQEIELDDLSNNNQRNGVHQAAVKTEVDGTVAAWTYTAAILLSIFSGILVISPRFLLFIVGETRTSPTPLEAFLALHFGIFLSAIAISLLVNIPSPETLPSKSVRLHWHPLLVPLTSASLLMSFLSYNTANVGSLSLIFSASTGVVGLWGFWTMMFADSSLVSKKTGADKHTSAFIFGNQSSASSLKKKWKRGE